MGRIGLSVLLGFLIGLERQITGHPAGIRINVLISMGACLFLMFPLMSGSDEVYRIASYIVSGVGFLCSGVIFKEGGTVRGLNTAATLWCTAAVGVKATVFPAKTKTAETPVGTSAKRRISICFPSAVVPQIPNQNPDQPKTSRADGQDKVQQQSAAAAFLSTTHKNPPCQALSFCCRDE